MLRSKSSSTQLKAWDHSDTSWRNRSGQWNLYCQFDLDLLPAGQLEQLETKAAKLGDYVLGGHLLREVDVVWSA